MRSSNGRTTDAPVSAPGTGARSRITKSSRAGCVSAFAGNRRRAIGNQRPPAASGTWKSRARYSASSSFGQFSASRGRPRPGDGGHSAYSISPTVTAMRTTGRCRSSGRRFSKPPRTTRRDSTGAPLPRDRNGKPVRSTISSSGTRRRAGSSSGNSGRSASRRSSTNPPNSSPRSRSGDGPTTRSAGMMRLSARVSWGRSTGDTGQAPISLSRTSRGRPAARYAITNSDKNSTANGSVPIPQAFAGWKSRNHRSAARCAHRSRSVCASSGDSHAASATAAASGSRLALRSSIHAARSWAVGVGHSAGRVSFATVLAPAAACLLK